MELMSYPVSLRPVDRRIIKEIYTSGLDFSTGSDRQGRNIPLETGVKSWIMLNFRRTKEMTFKISKHSVLGIVLLLITASGIGLVFIGLSMSPGEPVVAAAGKEKGRATDGRPSRKGSEMSQNRLRFEKSPYLLQHADNPVDWYPWGPEAFEKARKEDKPIFLSIGYSTCHWAHVMEHESFEDPEVAALMNEVFVSVKVDREERPDIDHIYMTVCQMMTGGGGWPLTVIMTPDKKPFFAATYIPKESRFGRHGMMELIPRVEEVWERGRDGVIETAEKIADALRETSAGAAGRGLGPSVLDAGYDELAGRFDEKEGGFGMAPKFPTPHNLLFLLRYWKRTGNEKALEMVEKTLSAMRRGGMYDHLGFGFHRYSTDPEWLVPHFEKMLYDQALLAMAYTEAYQATGKEEYGSTAREIFTYVLRDMTSPEGGFFSAEDADSEGEEGKFYLWTDEELRPHLKKKEEDLIVRLLSVERRGNFIDQMKRERTGDNILHRRKEIADVARSMDLPLAEGSVIFESARRKLFDAREKRVHPQKDDKILVDWNGLMIAALAKGAQALDDESYSKEAARAADFILSRMRDRDGRLLHRYRLGEAGLRANLDDYAFLIWGLIELYEASFDTRYLESALELNEIQLRHFWDEKEGGFYFTADDGESLLVRFKETYDGAVPAGNSVAALNLARLGRMTANAGYEEKAEKTSLIYSRNVERMPSAHTQFLVAVDFWKGPSYEIVVAGSLAGDDTGKMLTALRGRFIPNKVLLFRPVDVESPGITRLAAFTKSQSSVGGKATAYVCRNFRCELPTTDVGKMLELLAIENTR
jgi:uncharacterized protein YyaL (SSP411 family)